jgi:hypothetical protein
MLINPSDLKTYARSPREKSLVTGHFVYLATQTSLSIFKTHIRFRLFAARLLLPLGHSRQKANTKSPGSEAPRAF